jgi:hypothetical protein
MTNRSKNYELSTTTYFGITMIFIAAAIITMFPDLALAYTLEQQLDKVGALANGKVKTIGISGATILSAIYSVVRGNIKLAGVIVGIGAILGFYLEWVSAGMKMA